MFRLISKAPFPKESVSKLDKFYRLVLNYDGSVSKFIENLSGDKLIVDQLHHRQAKKDELKDQILAGQVSIKDQEIEVRYVCLRTKKFNELVYAKSYWSKAAYNSIMAKNPQIPIGFNMIQQRIEQFRNIDWMGETKIKLENGHELQGLSRSYTVQNGNSIICQIEEYYTPKYNQLFYT